MPIDFNILNIITFDLGPQGLGHHCVIKIPYK
jgi:hypothetical protein